MKIAPTLIGIVAGLVFVSPVGAATAPHQGKVQANGITIAYESFGKVDRETILLIGGTGMQLTDWPTEFCEEMVRRGYRVVIYDNRDIGLSTRFDAAGMPDFAAVVQAAAAGKPAPLAYTLYDMANDAVGLLDALGISKAHIVGASMGGMIAQIVATNHPEHTLSLTSIMATDGKPGLPIIANPERVAKIPPPAPNEDKEAYIARMVKSWEAIGSQTYPEDEHVLSERITRDVERSYCLACEARQGAASLFTAMEDRRLKLQTIHVPTVVVQGDEDPIIAMEAARDVAVSIQGAKLRVIHGMGHDVPPALVKTVADAIVSAASRADHRPTDESVSTLKHVNGIAPLDQYLMADRNAEIALARSAAPESISRDAEVLVLGRHGYETAVRGKNGFACVVERSWMAPFDDPEFLNPDQRLPLCLNPPAARSHLPLTLKMTELALAGLSKTQMFDTIKAAFDKKELPMPEPGAMCYMMSNRQYFGSKYGNADPHLMFWFPKTGDMFWGAGLPGSPVYVHQYSPEPITEFIISVSKWSDGTAAPAE